MSIISFLTENILIILFYLGVLAFFYINRKNVTVQLKFIFLYRTKWGLQLMDKIARNHRELVRLFGYISIGAGFIGMAVIMFFLLQGLYNLFFVPNAPPTISPVIPGVRIPGGIFIPFVQGILSIFIIAVIHEFSHGVVARAHNIPVKSSGPAMFGPFFAAFVEPDEAFMKKQSDVVQYSVFAAGSFSNILLSVLVAFLLVFAFNPLINTAFEPAGVSIQEVTDGYPAAEAGLRTDLIYTAVNGKPIENIEDFVRELDRIRPGEQVELESSFEKFTLTATEHPEDEQKAFIGVTGIHNRFVNDDSPFYKVLNWFRELFVLLFILGVGIGLANLMPLGPIDGGRMFLLALNKTAGEKRGSKLWVKLSLALLIIILLLLSPIFMNVFEGLF